MSVVTELIRIEADNTLSFGDYTLAEKAKRSDFAYNNGSYKVKTCREMTRLERDEVLAYESEPGTAVIGMKADESAISFKVEGLQDAQITIGGEPGESYGIQIDGKASDEVKASLSGKVSFSVELEEGKAVAVEVVRR
ncbi:MAG: endosialidase [Lachnospiraceae bacterium]|nr:endosialidase [Lachnospiraceae bacterium]